MSAATELWAAVLVDYDEAGLVTLTNTRDRNSQAINTARGVAAAQAVINLWPSFAQEPYDSVDLAHIEVAEMGVIAVLWRRGGSATAIAQVEWDEVFGDDGLIKMLKQTNARSRSSPKSSSGVTTSSELVNGRPVLGWSDRRSLPIGYGPRRILSRDVLE